MDHLHCQDCGTHFTKRSELDGHKCRPGEDCAQSSQHGQRGALAADAAGGIQARPATTQSSSTASPNRLNRVFERSHRE